MAFSSGILRGALTNLGNPCTVTAEVQQAPVCRFQINLHTSSLNKQITQPTINNSGSNQQLTSLNSSTASLSLSSNTQAPNAKK